MMLFIHAFFHAVEFYTRVPKPSSIPYSTQASQYSFIFFPLIGIFLGALNIYAYLFFSQYFSPGITIINIMMINSIITGGLHEDGLADFSDGVWGGSEPAKRLQIMKDSSIGVYGVLALVFSLGLKFFLWTELPFYHLIITLIILPFLSRFSTILITHNNNYVSENPKANNHILPKALQFYIILYLPLLVFMAFQYNFIIIPMAVCFAFSFLFRMYCKAKINGYNGDCIGALQQFNELILLYTVLWVGY